MTEIFCYFTKVGGALSGILFVVFLESILIMPGALKFYMVPLATIGAIFGFAVCVAFAGAKRVVVGIIGTAVCGVPYFIILSGINSEYNTEFVIMYALLFFGNISLFMLVGEVVERLFRA